MRSLPMLLRIAEEMTRLPRMAATHNAIPSSFFNAFFNEPAWTILPREQIARWQKEQWAGSPTPASNIGKNGYQLSIDVSEYKPSELSVKTVNNMVIIEGKSEQQEDEGSYISRNFVRRFSLPQGYKAEEATSMLSSDGVLTVSVPNPAKLEENANERVVFIQQTGPAHLNVKDNPPIEGEKEDEVKQK